MDFEPLQELVGALLSGDRRRQRAAVEEHVADNVSFSHILGKVEGREAFYGIYRAAGTVWDYKIGWHEYIRSGNTVVLVLDLGIKVPPFYLVRYHFATIVLLRFAPDAAGKLRLVEQVDHHSLLAALWLLNWPFTAVSEMVVRPLSGFVFSRAGWALDWVAAIKEGGLSALRGGGGAAVGGPLSPPVLGQGGVAGGANGGRALAAGGPAAARKAA